MSRRHYDDNCNSLRFTQNRLSISEKRPCRSHRCPADTNNVCSPGDVLKQKCQYSSHVIGMFAGELIWEEVTPHKGMKLLWYVMLWYDIWSPLKHCNGHWLMYVWTCIDVLTDFHSINRHYNQSAKYTMCLLAYPVIITSQLPTDTSLSWQSQASLVSMNNRNNSH